MPVFMVGAFYGLEMRPACGSTRHKFDVCLLVYYMTLLTQNPEEHSLGRKSIRNLTDGRQKLNIKSVWDSVGAFMAGNSGVLTRELAVRLWLQPVELVFSNKTQRTKIIVNRNIHNGSFLYYYNCLTVKVTENRYTTEYIYIYIYTHTHTHTKFLNLH